MVVDPAEQPFVAPAAEVAKGRAFGRQILRDQAPGNAPAQHVEDGIQDLAGGPGSRAPARGRLRHERGHHRPLRIRQVCFVTKAGAAMVPPGSWGPHGTSRSGFSTRLKAPPARPINPTHPFPDGLLQKRMVKYQDKLFTFIRHDGVPWNNNNAENAIKRFAYYREDTVGIMREAGLNDYLMLLSLYMTCRFK